MLSCGDTPEWQRRTCWSCILAEQACWEDNGGIDNEMYEVAGCRYYWDGNVVIYVQVARKNGESALAHLTGLSYIVNGQE